MSDKIALKSKKNMVFIKVFCEGKIMEDYVKIFKS